MFSIVSKKSIGIDIADNSIEVAELKKIGGKIVVSSLGRISLPAGVVKNGSIIDGQKLSEALKNALNQAEPHPISDKKIIFGFPERQTFFHVFSYKNAKGKNKLSDEEIKEIVFEEAWSNIPLAKNKMIVDFEVLEKSEDGMKILIVAAEKGLTQEWYDFFKRMKFDVGAFDIEALANFRHLTVSDNSKPVCLVDMGSACTNIYIFKKNKLFFERTINIAGNAITAEITKSLKIKKEEAEKNKIDFGISNPDSPCFSVIIKVLENILGEVKVSLDHFKSLKNQEIKQLILIGGSSQLKGLKEFFETNLEISVNLGESKFLKDKKIEYLGAVGIALRGLNKKADGQDPKIIFSKKRKKEIAEETPKDLTASVYSQESEDDFLLDDEEAERAHRLFIKKISLVLVLVTGIVLISTAFIWRSYDKNKKQNKIEALFQQINNLEVHEEESQENLATSTEIVVVSDEASSTEEQLNIWPQILIKETSTGWLNVRQGPGTTHGIVAKVSPGELYGLVSEEDGWIEIILDTEEIGWVYGEYVEKIN